MPFIIFVAVFALSGNVFGFQFTLTQIFPSEHRVTASSLCFFSGNVISILGPIIAEQDEPVPIMVLIFVNICGLSDLAISTFPRFDTNP
jgi:hypothetical protein